MKYEEFKQLLKDKIAEYLRDDFKNYEIRESKVTVVNMSYDGLVIISDKDGGKGPTLNLNKLYSEYLKNSDMEEVLERTAESVKREITEHAPKINIDWTQAEKSIVLQLINTERNQELLEHAPHRDFLDMSVVYRFIVEEVSDQGFRSGLINDGLAEYLELDEAQLYLLARENTLKRLQPVIMSQSGVMQSLCEKGGIPAGDLQDELDEEIWIIGNRCDFNGASSVLFEEYLEEIAKSTEKDIYLIPLSINEIMVVATDKVELDYMRAFLEYMNQDYIPQDEYLSDQIYLYDRERKKVVFASEPGRMGPDHELMEENTPERVTEASR